MLIIEFAVLFLVVLVLGYLLPAGQFYYLYHVRQSGELEKHRIQAKRPLPGQVAREVKLSLISVSIFAAMATVLFQLYKAGHTGIYWRFRDYPLWYLPLSLFLCFLLHDTYFYWTHRFMHWRPVFKYMHAGHHRSITPTPWAIFAFQPLEAVIQFIGIMLLVVFVPLHPLILLAFFWIDSLVNTAGHTGFELVPKWIARSWLYSGFNTVTHHDSHHTNMKVNFGSFFNIWDRWMGTYLPDEAAVDSALEGSRTETTGTREARRRPVTRRRTHPSDRVRAHPV